MFETWHMCVNFIWVSSTHTNRLLFCKKKWDSNLMDEHTALAEADVHLAHAHTHIIICVSRESTLNACVCVCVWRTVRAWVCVSCVCCMCAYVWMFFGSPSRQTRPQLKRDAAFSTKTISNDVWKITTSTHPHTHSHPNTQNPRCDTNKSLWFYRAIK